MNIRRILLAGLCSAALAQAAWTQTTWHVDVDSPSPGNGSSRWPYSSLQFAVDQVSTVDGDTLLIAPGIYYENLAVDGKTLVLRSEYGSSTVVIDAARAGSCVTLANGAGPEMRIEGITFVNGSGTATPWGTTAGGGVFAENVSVVFDDCVFLRNSCAPLSGVGEGGGLFIKDAGVVALLDCVLASNVAVGGDGQAVHAVDSLSLFVTNCQLLSNGSIHGLGGGAVHNVRTELYVTNSRFEGNVCDGPGGALSVIDCLTEIDQTEFVNNESSGHAYGGAVYASPHPATKLLVVEGTFRGNRSGGGGAVYVGSGLGTFDQCTFVANQARSAGPELGAGGGLFVDAGADVQTLRCVFSENISEGDGASVPGRGAGVFGPASLDRCTLYGNQALDAGAPGSGGGAFGADLESCIAWANAPDALAGGTTAAWSDIEGGWPGTGNIDSDPLFLTDPPLALGPGSPCIDAGDPAAPVDPDGSRADMGAIPWVWISIGTDYCDSNANSTGSSAQLTALGTSVVDDDFVVLETTQVPPMQFGYYLFSDTQGFVPLFGGSQGDLCLGGSIVRFDKYVLDSGTAGRMVFQLPLDNLPQGIVIAPGETWSFQLWFRDQNPGSTSNTSSGVEVTFQ